MIGSRWRGTCVSMICKRCRPEVRNLCNHIHIQVLAYASVRSPAHPQATSPQSKQAKKAAFMSLMSHPIANRSHGMHPPCDDDSRRTGYIALLLILCRTVSFMLFMLRSSITIRPLIRPIVSTHATFHQAAIRSKSPIHSTQHRSITMSTPEQRGKITGWASNDGSFKRQTSSFRDSVEKGGKFEPEKGEFRTRREGHLAERPVRPIPPLRQSCLVCAVMKKLTYSS